MIFHENCLPADNSHEISCLICYFWKSGKIWNCRLLQTVGGALRVKYRSLLYAYKKYPLILPIFLHKNTKSCITLLAFSDSVSPSSIVYPRRTIFTLVLYLGKTRQRAGIWIKYYYDVIFSTVLSFLNVCERKTQRWSAHLTSQMTSYICDDVA